MFWKNSAKEIKNYLKQSGYTNIFAKKNSLQSLILDISRSTSSNDFVQLEVFLNF